MAANDVGLGKVWRMTGDMFGRWSARGSFQDVLERSGNRH